MVALFWLIVALFFFTVSVYFWVWLIYLLIIYAPLWLFIWFSWDTIASYGFLGYWGILGLLILPLLFVVDKNLGDHEYHATSIGFMVWAAPPLMYGIYSYWNIAQWILGAMFFIGCIAFALSSNEEDSQESSETNSGDEEPWYDQYIEDKS